MVGAASEGLANAQKQGESKPETTIVDINKLTHFLKDWSVTVTEHFAQRIGAPYNAIGY